jgi:transcriptional antiterminator NusG
MVNDAPNRLPWFAVRVRAKHESGVAEQLAGKGYESFLPTRICSKQWSDRIKNAEAALFPGYLFCRFDPQYRLPILKTPGVVEICGYKRIPVAIEEGELEAIRALVNCGLASQAWPFLAVGDRVRITAGALTGHEGFLVAFKGGYRLVLSVALLQRSVAVEIDSASVEGLRPRPMVGERSLPPFAMAI